MPHKTRLSRERDMLQLNRVQRLTFGAWTGTRACSTRRTEAHVGASGRGSSQHEASVAEMRLRCARTYFCLYASYHTWLMALLGDRGTRRARVPFHETEKREWRARIESLSERDVCESSAGSRRSARAQRRTCDAMNCTTQHHHLWYLLHGGE